jgi:sulfite exporter TauE/SafE
LSEESNFWIITIIGVLMLYFTATSSDNLNVFTGFFIFLSAILIILGLFLLLARPSE